MSSTSSMESADRHTTCHFSHASIEWPAANVPSGQLGSPEPELLFEKMVSIALGDQLINSMLLASESMAGGGAEVAAAPPDSTII